MPPHEPPPALWVDTGGTFTDALVRRPDGALERAKVLSTSALRGRLVEAVGERSWRVAADWLELAGREPTALAGCRFAALGRSAAPAGMVERLEGDRLGLAAPPADGGGLAPGALFEVRSADEAPVFAARLLTATPGDRPLPRLELRLATTRGTNALLERRGARVILFVTEGFEDLLRIGDQTRPDLFALAPERPAPLAAAVIGVGGRLAADGTEFEPLELLDEDALDERLAAVVARSGESEGAPRSLAVSLLHAYRDDGHERRLAAVLADLGHERIVRSTELAPLVGYLARTETAVVEAYLAPVVGGYLERVTAAVRAGGGRVLVMTSAGGLAAADRYRAKDSLLSGPAGGVVGAAAAGRRSGLERLIGFDMGGTSTDVARFAGELDYRFEQRVGDARLVAPALAIETVAAGGGSVCRWVRGELEVGPESAGADPGPACYGAGGPLTLTDVDLLLGRLDPWRFGLPIDVAAARRELVRLVAEVAGSEGSEAAGDEAAETLLAGCLRIADERMADAVRRVSVGRGFDPAEHALVAFGGAGGLHACALAELLGMTTVLVPRDAGLLSAVGLGAAVVERFAERQVLAPLDEVAGQLDGWLAELGRQAAAEVGAQGVPAAAIEVRRRIVRLRLAGQETAIAIEAPAIGDLRPAFDAAYRELYGYPPPARPIEVESLRVAASSRPSPDEPPPAVVPRRRAEPTGRRRAWFGGWRDVPVHDRATLAPGDWFTGPALVHERHAATVVAPGWHAAVDGAGALLLRRER